jgi:hypothetical protein
MLRHGIRCTLPASDPMAAPHLLGPDWVDYYWYATPAERDAALAEKAAEHRFSRQGDAPRVVYAAVERDPSGAVR